MAAIATALSELFPDPEPVELAGRMFLVGQLRMRDLAEVERLLSQLVPHPLAEYPPADADPDPATRPKRLMDAYRRSTAWPLVYGSDEAQAVMATGPGMAAYLYVVLSRHNKVTVGEVARLLPAIAPAEWAALDRAAWEASVREELFRELNPELLEGPSQGRGRDWGEVAYEVAAARHLTLAQVGEMTVAEFAWERRAGKPRALPGRKFASFKEAAEYRRKRAAELGIAGAEAGADGLDLDNLADPAQSAGVADVIAESMARGMTRGEAEDFAAKAEAHRRKVLDEKQRTREARQAEGGAGDKTGDETGAEAEAEPPLTDTGDPAPDPPPFQSRQPRRRRIRVPVRTGRRRRGRNPVGPAAELRGQGRGLFPQEGRGGQASGPPIAGPGTPPHVPGRQQGLDQHAHRAEDEPQDRPLDGIAALLPGDPVAEAAESGGADQEQDEDRVHGVGPPGDVFARSGAILGTPTAT